MTTSPSDEYRSGACGGDGLFDEPGLADPWVAADEAEASTTFGQREQVGVERAELLLAADERVRSDTNGSACGSMGFDDLGHRRRCGKVRQA